MTRLTEADITPISNSLVQYNKHLQMATGGHGLLEIGCCCWGVTPEDIRQRIGGYTVQVIPSSAGLGIISNFSESVAAILRFLGFSSSVAREPDVSGLAQTLTSQTNAMFMADDHAFISYDLDTRKLVDNTIATGRMFATALSLMSTPKRFTNEKTLVIGCGPVGHAAAKQIVVLGGSVTLFDTNRERCRQVKDQLTTNCELDTKDCGRIGIGENLTEALNTHRNILDATPDAKLIQDAQVSQDIRIALPGVPPGISEEALSRLAHHAIHDKLELGVTGMAVGLFN